MSSAMNDPSGGARTRETQQMHQGSQTATFWGYLGGQALSGLLGTGIKILLIVLPILGGVLFGGAGVFIALLLDVAFVAWWYWPKHSSIK